MRKERFKGLKHNLLPHLFSNLPQCALWDTKINTFVFPASYKQAACMRNPILLSLRQAVSVWLLPLKGELL